MEYFGFEDMDLQQGLLRAISEKGYAEPTPIQELAIPAALAGHDVMGQAQTGTGKTASFGIPILNRIVPGKGLQGLILCPTRELAVQVSEEINSLGIYLSIYTLAVYGGQAITIQFKGLEKNPEIIVATPGRIMDHMNRRSIDLQTLEFIVLDEADEMLDMGFLPDIEKILRNCPKKRQTSLFSATLSERIRNLGKKFMNNPQVFSVSSGECTIAEIQYCFYEVNSQRKLETLCKIIDVKAPASCLIFCRTKRSVGKLAGMLKRYGYSAGALHGDMSQSERDHVMRKFRSNKLSILVATDLAARGLDIDVVSHVINFDLPEAPDIFIHRTGRTGRAGRSGEAITLVDESQFRQLYMIEKHIGQSISKEELPVNKAVNAHEEEYFWHRMLRATKNPEAGNHSDEFYKHLAGKFLSEHTAVDLVATFLRLLDEPTPKFEIVNTGFENQHHNKKTDTKTRNNKGYISKKNNIPAQLNETVIIEQPLGKSGGYTSKQIVDYIIAHSSLTENLIGDIEVNNSSCYIEIPMDRVDEVYSVFHNMNRNGRNASSSLPRARARYGRNS